jgi:hypothetical protein
MEEQERARLSLVRGSAGKVSRPAPAVGEIWTAQPDRGSEAIVLITAVPGDYVEALLCGRECHWATETDAVLSPLSTGSSPHLLVHGDIAGSIMKHRLRRLIGRIDPQVAERLALRGRGLDFNATDLGRGKPITSDSDPRFGWKLEQHKRMRRLRARAAELGWQIHTLGGS